MPRNRQKEHAGRLPFSPTIRPLVMDAMPESRRRINWRVFFISTMLLRLLWPVAARIIPAWVLPFS